MPKGQPAPGSNSWLTFDVTSMNVVETSSAPPVLPPYTIIPRNTQFKLIATFEFAEALANWFVCLPLNWKATFYYEYIGSGPEDKFGDVNGSTQCGQLEYDAELVFAGLTEPGTYLLTATVAVIDNNNNPSPIAGFVEGPMIQIT